MESLTGLPTTVMIGVCGIYLLAGLIKGTLGIGLPTAGVSLTAQFTDARTAIALVLMPMLITNLWQVWRTREYTSRARAYWPLALTMMFGIAGAAIFAPTLNIQWVTLALGITVLIFSIVSLLKVIPPLNAKYDRQAQTATGIVAGIMGGITSVWAPPIVIYLSATRIDKTTFVAVTGVLLGLGSSVLTISYSTVGLLSKPQLIASLLLVLPAIAGFTIGERIRNRLDEELFKRLILMFFFLMGLNLIRKALW